MFKLIYIFFVVFFCCLISFPAFSQTSFDTYMERCEDLRPEIEQILKDEGLPEYFFYLALAESGCDPKNKSNRDAMGLFQLVPYTFRVYSKGVCNTESMDKYCPISAAYDPLISTQVAAKYLKSLYDRFDGDVNWVVAAYNAGGTNLIRKTSYHKGMDIKVVRKYFPQAYELAMKVRAFSKMGEQYDHSDQES